MLEEIGGKEKVIEIVDLDDSPEGDWVKLNMEI